MIQSVKPHPASNPYPILRPLAHQPLRFISLTREMIGLDTHYGDNGTYICPGEEKCSACGKGHPARWNGYLIGKSLINGSIAVCHLTAAAGIELQSHYEKPRGFLGAKILLVRTLPVMNAPVEAKLFGWEDDVCPVPADRALEIVARIYRKQITTPDGSRDA